jgi:hypothetical protein
MRPESPPVHDREQPVENGQPCGASDSLVVVTENLEADHPITAAELAVIETYLGDIMDKLFEDMLASSGGANPARRKA